MKPSGTSGIRKKLALTALASVAGGALLWNTIAGSRKLPYPAYTVKQVVDGDSLYLTNGLEIRLADVDAPEISRCGGQEAKEGLEKLVTGKPIYLFIVAEDTYHRLLSMVYTDTAFVNAEMLRKGLVTYPSSTAAFADTLRSAIEEARTNGRGIHGLPCTQKINTEHPKCTVKGNIKNSNKYYYPPDCPWYDQAYVQLYLGEQWFCSDKEAIKAGYTLAPRCK